MSVPASEVWFDTPRRLDEWWTASAWVDGTLASRGLAMVGAPQTLKVRPWSSVAKLQVMPHTNGSPGEPTRTVWFKANGPGSRYEAALLTVLAECVPHWTVAPIAVDTARGWSLLPHGGPTLRDMPGTEVPAWERFLTAMARLQVAMVDRIDALVGAGVPYLPTQALPEHLDALLAEPHVWTNATPESRDAVRAVVPAYRQLCAELAAGVVPASIQHNDLHDGNVLGDGERFFDWGDAYVGHPFGVLLVTLRRARQTFKLPDGDPALDRLRDAYIEPWMTFAPRQQLLREVDLALVAARVAYALSWQRALLGAGPEALRQWDGGTVASLGELAEPGLFSFSETDDGMIRCVTSLDELAAVYDLIGAQLTPTTTSNDRKYDDLARRFALDRQLMLVAERAGFLLGGALAFRQDADLKSVTLRIVGIDPGHRGRGLGRRLVHAVEQAAAVLGAESIYLAAGPGERDFYRKLGYSGKSRMYKAVARTRTQQRRGA